MTTKQQCLNALARLHPEAELEDRSGAGFYEVALNAPVGMHWPSVGAHGSVICDESSESKTEFWSVVLEEIKELDKPENCTAETCPDWQLGKCNVWGSHDE